MPSGRFVRAKDLQQDSKGLIDNISETGETCYITEDGGRARAVLLDINRYNALMDLVEEAESPRDEQPDTSRDTISVRDIIEKSNTRILRKRRK